MSDTEHEVKARQDGAFLLYHRLTFEKIEMLTPRRLAAVRVVGLADKQSDLTEDFKGPSKKIALDADGNSYQGRSCSGSCNGLLSGWLLQKQVNLHIKVD